MAKPAKSKLAPKPPAAKGKKPIVPPAVANQPVTLSARAIVERYGKAQDKMAEPAAKAKKPGKGATMTISGPGIEPVTLTDKQLKGAVAKLKKQELARRDLVEAPDDDQPELIPKSESGGEVPERNTVGALTGTSREKLRQTVARIERLEEERKDAALNIKEVYAEAKALGFDTKALRKVISLRKIDKAERDEQEMVLETYLFALGEI